MLGTVYKMSDACIPSELWVGGELNAPRSPEKSVLLQANFLRIAQYPICCPTCAQATTQFWLRHCRSHFLVLVCFV